MRDSTGFENEVAVRSSLRIAPVLTCPVSHGRAKKKALAARGGTIPIPKKHDSGSLGHFGGMGTGTEA